MTAILVVVGLLAFGLFVVGPCIVWLITAFDRPRLHWWEAPVVTACPKCGQPGARDVPHVCLFAGLPYDKQPTTLRLAHAFEGDPWGSCKACGHPVYHEIHRERPS